MKSFRRPRRRTLLVTVGVVVLALVAGAVAAWWWWWPRPTPLQEAARLLPADTVRVNFTHWQALRDELDPEAVSGAAGEEFAAEIGDRELSTSPLLGSAPLLEEGLGLNPLAAEWEVFGQSAAGQAVVMRTEADLGEVRRRIAELGFAAPSDDGDSGGVWFGGADAIAAVPGLATYELQSLAFFDDEGLVVGSDSPDHLAEVVKVIRGDADGLDVDQLLEPAGEALTAAVLLGERACGELSLATADTATQAEARALVDQVGGVVPLTGYVVAQLPSRRLAVVFGYESEERAEGDRRPRSALAGAEDPAQGLSYPELFTLRDAEVDGSTLTLTGDLADDAFPISALAEGPVLLATC